MSRKPKIKFSHDYPKLADMGKSAILLDVLLIERDELSDALVYYDTADLYELPNGRVLLLLFSPGPTRLFTTIRKYTPDKLEYYFSRIGKEFVIEIGGSEK